MHVVSRRHYRATQYRVSERARKRGLAREKCQLAGPKGGGWVYTQLDLEVPWCRAVSRNPRKPPFRTRRNGSVLPGFASGGPNVRQVKSYASIHRFPNGRVGKAPQGRIV